MNDLWLPNLVPAVTFLFILAALARRMRRARTPRPVRAPSRSSIVPSPRPAAGPQPPAAAAAPAAARPVRRRLAEPAMPAAPARIFAAPPVGDVLLPEAAAAFPVLDLSLGDPSPSGPAAAAPRRRRGFAGGIPVGSRGWGPSAILAAEILGPPVGLRPGATVGVPHAF